MINLCKMYISDFTGFIRKNVWFSVVLILTLIAAYGFRLTSFAISRDVSFGVFEKNFFEQYRDAVFHLRSLRWFTSLLFGMLDAGTVTPFWTDFVGLTLLFVASVTWCLLFSRISGGRLSTGALLVFATVFVSYPLVHEYFIWISSSIFLGVGYLFVALALMLVHESFPFQGRSRYPLWAGASVLVACVAAMYESFLVVYMCGVLLSLLIPHVLDRKSEKPVISQTAILLTHAGVLAAGVIIRTVIAKGLCLLLNVSGKNVAGNKFAWFDPETSPVARAAKIALRLGYDVVYNAFFYQPICVFDVTVALMVVLCAWHICRKRRYHLLWLCPALIAANFVLAFIQGSPMSYRMCQSFSLFVGAGWMIFFAVLQASRHRVMVGCLVGWLVLMQTKELSSWFYNNYRCSEMDKANATLLVESLREKYGASIEQPIAFVGGEITSYPCLRNTLRHAGAIGLPKVYGPSSENGIPVFSTLRRDELFLFLKIACCAELKKPSDGQLEEAKSFVESTQPPVWPREGAIVEHKGCIIVNLGKVDRLKEGQLGGQFVDHFKRLLRRAE